MQALKFTNFSTESFSCKYDGMVYTFNSGETMFLEDFKAHHFAKHLIDRELTRLSIDTNNQVARGEMETKCFTSNEFVTPEEAININEVVKETKKGSKKAKVVEEFADLETEDEDK